ncbi:G [Kumasi rhabdovirus]|uniref:G n=1 Tax=Kumasi rhabdovirus TaxID=1537975 RepID=A0A0C4MKA3_9RHAB|nr:G [Kumasi rhabdovirus] [Kumasi rhabdovirus]AIL31437.1 G [Kumasi rhabdovirus] [Kumasi rhabdovirus]
MAGFYLLALTLVCYLTLVESDGTPAPVVKNETGDFLWGLGTELILPVEVISKWVEINPEDMRCPSDPVTDHVIGAIVGHTRFSRYSGFHKATQKGFLCHKMRWITACTTTWYFSHDVQRRVEAQEPGTQECLDQVKKRGEGTEEEGSYPPSQCAWNSVNEEAEVVIHLTVHEVRVDPYTMELLDPVFPSGRCNTTACDTVHQSVLWIEDPSKTRPSCGDRVVDEGNIIRSGWTDNVPGAYYLISQHLPPTKIDGACRLSFCGESGLLFENGIWTHDIKLETVVANQTFQNCQADRRAGAVGPTYEIDKLRFDWEAAKEKIKCLDMIEIISATGALSFRRLHHFNPRTPGIHPVYRIVNKTLQMAKAHYVVTNNPMSHKGTRDCLGTYMDHDTRKCVAWHHWVDVGNGTEQGPNGLLVTGDKVSYPHWFIREKTWDPALHIINYLQNADHPIVSHLGRYIDNASRDSLRKDRSENVGDAASAAVTKLAGSIGGVFKDVWHVITTCVTVGVIIIIILIFRRMIGVFWRGREKHPLPKTPNNIYQETHELKSFG